jgi:hypothetical protein
MEKVCALVRVGRKVVVAASTKTYTSQLEQYLKTKLADLNPRIMVYNSSTERTIMEDHASKPNEIWSTFDVLIFSESIVAGLSFEMLHYDTLVAYLENSLFTPTVDFAMQQLFRVRCLRRGGMFIYLNDVINVDISNYPVDDKEIADWLDKHTNNIQTYFPSGIMESPFSVSTRGLMFDRDRLSYQLLKGIVMNKNRSLIYFNESTVNS